MRLDSFSPTGPLPLNSSSWPSILESSAVLVAGAVLGTDHGFRASTMSGGPLASLRGKWPGGAKRPSFYAGSAGIHCQHRRANHPPCSGAPDRCVQFQPSAWVTQYGGKLGLPSPDSALYKVSGRSRSLWPVATCTAWRCCPGLGDECGVVSGLFSMPPDMRRVFLVLRCSVLSHLCSFNCIASPSITDQPMPVRPHIPNLRQPVMRDCPPASEAGGEAGSLPGGAGAGARRRR